MAMIPHQSFMPSKRLLVPALGMVCAVLLSTGCTDARPDEATAQAGTAAPAAAAPAAGTYTVKSGDTLTKIALAELGSKDRWKDIKAANEGLDVTQPLSVGQILNMPAK